jgi:hypothetical protein
MKAEQSEETPVKTLKACGGANTVSTVDILEFTHEIYTSQCYDHPLGIEVGLCTGSLYCNKGPSLQPKHVMPLPRLGSCKGDVVEPGLGSINRNSPCPTRQDKHYFCHDCILKPPPRAPGVAETVDRTTYHNGRAALTLCQRRLHTRPCRPLIYHSLECEFNALVQVDRYDFRLRQQPIVIVKHY